MNRRSFLAALGLTTGVLAAPELWTPSRTFFLPPRGGWLPPGTAAIQNPYTYQWAWLSGGSGLIINSPLASSTTFDGFGEGIAVCEVTDGRRHASISVAIVRRVAA